MSGRLACGVCGQPAEVDDVTEQAWALANRVLAERRQQTLTAAEVVRCPTCRGAKPPPGLAEASSDVKTRRAGG